LPTENPLDDSALRLYFQHPLPVFSIFTGMGSIYIRQRATHRLVGQTRSFPKGAPFPTKKRLTSGSKQKGTVASIFNSSQNNSPYMFCFH